MCLKLSKKNRSKVADLISKSKEFSYLVNSGKVIFRKDSDFDIPEI